MIQSNYFTDNTDLQQQFNEIVEWPGIVNMYENGFVAQKIGYASAVSVAFFFTVTAIALLQRFLMKNE